MTMAALELRGTQPTKDVSAIRGARIAVLLLVTLAGCGTDSPATSNNATNHAPVANAGADQTVDSGALTTLDGSHSSDADGDPLTFLWRQTSGTPVSLSAASAAVATFAAPGVGTTAAFELTVDDGHASSVGLVHVSVHPVESSAQVVEVHQQPITDDPAVRGDLPAEWLMKNAPPGPSAPPGYEEGAPSAIEDNLVQFAPLVEADLAPGATREVELQVAAASALRASVRWFGTSEALQVDLSIGNTPLATGTAVPIAPDRGETLVSARTTGAGRAVVSVTNTSAEAVSVRVFFGALPL